MDNISRKNISLAGSLAFHFMVFLLIAFTGILSSRHINDDIIDISFVCGGGGGAAAESVMNTDGIAHMPVQEEITSNEEIIPELEKEFAQNVVKKAAISASTITGSTNAIKNENNYSDGNGSGKGNGSGSGSGGGHGSGSGTNHGDGSGIAVNPAVPPRIVKSVAPVYPANQRRNNITGTAHLRLLIAKNGMVEDVTVLKSSGNSGLDHSAVTACRKWRFVSAKNKLGHDVRCYLDIPIRFNLER